ncbi:MAG: hypothetical protein BWY11_02002 [Firmicutes bacterium ADurb.Bin182]|nr:MAG: hypothetical protein BWY11_02002 [Firmicutes bacterium ADurb.Bin182]
MNRQEFMNRLREALKKLPDNEKQAALEYYREYFDEAGPENEQQVVDSLGLPEQVAAEIYAETAIRNMEKPGSAAKKGASAVWLILLAIFASPIALPIAIALAAVLLALIVALFAIIFALFIAAIALVAAGIAAPFTIGGFFGSFAGAVSGLGVSLFVIGAGVACCVFVIWVFKSAFKGIAKLFSKTITGRKEK